MQLEKKYTDSMIALKKGKQRMHIAAIAAFEFGLDWSREAPAVYAVPASPDWIPFPGVRGFDFRVIEGGEKGSVATIECHWRRGGFFPPHVHPNSVEKFHIIDGCVTLYTEDGMTQMLTAGETYEIPAGVKHAGFSHSNTHFTANWIPPLDLLPTQ